MTSQILAFPICQKGRISFPTRVSRYQKSNRSVDLGARRQAHPTGKQAVPVAALPPGRGSPREVGRCPFEPAPARGQPFSFHLYGRDRVFLRNSHLCPQAERRLPPWAVQEAPTARPGSTALPTQRPGEARDPRRAAGRLPGGVPAPSLQPLGFRGPALSPPPPQARSHARHGGSRARDRGI